MDENQIFQALAAQAIETPSWAYGNSGTRFKTFNAPGAARNVFEKIDDAAEVHRLTGITPSIALHIPWDNVSDFSELKGYAENNQIKIGAINPNLFQKDIYKLGSIANPDSNIREEAIADVIQSIEIMQKTGSRDLSLWFADGTNYAGQDSIRKRQQATRESLQQIEQALPNHNRMLIEYKFYEPAFYHTDLFDWGIALNLCQKLSNKAKVLVDLGHHAQSVNIEAIIATLLLENKLGGFHFNARRYGDDDLIVGSTNPFELFCIYVELLEANATDVAYMIDQSHNIEPKIEAMVLSVLNCQTAYAKALHVDFDQLHQAQNAGDVLGAHRILTDAFETDVRPIIQAFRRSRDLPLDPISEHRQSDYLKSITEKRGTEGAGSGYPNH